MNLAQALSILGANIDNKRLPTALRNYMQRCINYLKTTERIFKESPKRPLSKIQYEDAKKEFVKAAEQCLAAVKALPPLTKLKAEDMIPAYKPVPSKITEATTSQIPDIVKSAMKAAAPVTTVIAPSEVTPAYITPETVLSKTDLTGKPIEETTDVFAAPLTNGYVPSGISPATEFTIKEAGYNVLPVLIVIGVAIYLLR